MENLLPSTGAASAAGSPVYLSPGEWKIALTYDDDGTGASVALSERDAEAGDPRTISKNGEAVALVVAAPQIIYKSGGEWVTATLTGNNAGNVEVNARPIEAPNK